MRRRDGAVVLPSAMPQYEYLCEVDGERITLLRPMRDADLPVEDPEGRGRTFSRVLSVPMVGTAASAAGARSAAPSGGCCPCGKSGGCGG